MCALAGDAERYPLDACGPRWLQIFALEHATLAPAIDVARENGDLVVAREPLPAAAQSLADAPATRPHRAALLLQAAAAIAFFAAHGVALRPEDLEGAAWEPAAAGAGRGGARLWLTRMPRLVAGEDPGAGPSAAEALAAFVFRLFARGRRVTHRAAAALLAQLRAPEARWKRPEFWLAGVLRAFPELASPAPAAAAARRRTLGIAGEALRTAEARALVEKARALARGGEPRVFRAASSSLTPGGALGIGFGPDASGVGVGDAREASRRLREDAARTGARTVWISVAAEEWDPVSRRAFESAALALPDGAERVRVPRALPPPDAPAQWRQALWIPCGTIAASVRFYERFAETAAAAPGRGLEQARAILGSVGWAAFAADPTGDAPWPSGGLPAPPPQLVRGHAGELRDHEDDDPGRRVDRLLEEGRHLDALEEARLWVKSASARGPNHSAESWFPLAARLRAALPDACPPPAWLEAIEAERELAGGRPADAAARLERVVRERSASPGEKRRAALRSAEIAAVRDAWPRAVCGAAAWRREHSGSGTPPGETLRAVGLEAAGLARAGRFEEALSLAAEAEGLASGLSVNQRVEAALLRAQILALAGREAEEEAAYDGIRPVALASGDATAARFLAQEARRLLDRREFPRAILRFQEALAAERDDAGERAALLLDLAAALYHAGDAAGSETRLSECQTAAAAAGRDDLVRIARGNRIELLIDRGAWDAASAEIAALEGSAGAEEDSIARLVALHHRGRLALRRGFLDAAAADNARAREMAERLADRLEIGELWLEEGDRRLYAGDLDSAAEAYERAAERPPDRSGREALSRVRREELGWRGLGAPPESALAALDARFDADPYGAAETVVRWRFVLGPDAVPAALRDRAERILRSRGGGALADRAFPRAAREPAREALRGLREEIAAVFRGDEPDGHRTLESLGVAGLVLRDGEGRELARLGRAEAAGERLCVRRLEAGSARFELALWPAGSEEAVEPIAWLLETLLFRAEPPRSPLDFAEGWRRLGLVTADRSMEEPYLRLTRFAAQPVTVLVLGPSGSGKEAVARAVHRLSPRSAGPFVAVNVPAIPAALLESELFGHARGAFTGAERDRRGLLEEAAGGSIFFDEIGDLAPPLQAKLLRALQEREIRRVGENRPRPIDVRVVSATSRDLAERVEAGQFREDLFYRLHVAVLRLPALRDRGRDALLLARHFLDGFAREYGRGRLTLAPEAAAAILAYPWPGNVRELQNAISQAAALCDAEGCVGAELLPERVRLHARTSAGGPPGDYRTRVDAHRRDLIADALGRAGGNRTRAARQLGLSRQALHYLMRELRIGSSSQRS